MTGILIAPGVFAMAVALYAVLARCLPGANRVVLYLACGTVVGGVWLSLDGAFAASSEVESIAGAMVYACLSELFGISIVVTTTSISASLIVRIDRQPMTLADVVQAYPSAEMVRTRIERMLQAGYLSAEGESLCLTRRGWRAVRVFVVLQGFFGHGR